MESLRDRVSMVGISWWGRQDCDSVGPGNRIHLDKVVISSRKGRWRRNNHGCVVGAHLDSCPDVDRPVRSIQVVRSGVRSRLDAAGVRPSGGEDVRFPAKVRIGAYFRGLGIRVA